MPTHDLFDFMKQASDAIQAEYERIAKRSREDTGTAGEEGEGNWRQLLRQWLPPQCRIETRGRIIFADGSASPQADVIVLSPEYPAGLADKKLYFAGGVLAVFECKLTLRASDIREAFKDALHLTSRLPTRSGTPYRELHRPIAFGLLAHSHDWKRETSTPVDNVKQQLLNVLEHEISHPKEMPDVICISDAGTWTAMRASHFGAYSFCDGKWKWKSEPPTIHGAYMLHSDSHSQTERPFTNVGALVCDLFTRLGRERAELRSVADYFEAVGISGRAQGIGRDWPFTLYSGDVQQKLVAEFDADPPPPETRIPRFSPGDRWSEWSRVFF